jgi:hypothetical protein
MVLLDRINEIGSEIKAEVKQDGNKISMEAVIAERKAFLSKKKLTYKAKIELDDENKKIRFSEMLKESGLGLSSGDSDSSAGFGFKTETYNTMGGARKGNIEEQSTLFGKKYSYSFDYAAIRNKVEQAAKELGYTFEYHLL